MKSIRVKGLRSINDTREYELKDINIIVGTNSSGKSTFIRIFPLLRQSAEKKTRGPILWNGDYIDFGSFDTSVTTRIEENKKIKAECIELFFEFDYFDKKNFYFRKEKIPLKLNIKIRESKNGLGCYTSDFICNIHDHDILFSFNEDGTITSITSERINWNLGKQELKYQITDTDNLIPVLKSETYNVQGQRNKQLSEIIYGQVLNIFKSYSGSMSQSKLDRITSVFMRIAKTDVERLKIIQSEKITKKWTDTVRHWGLNDTTFKFVCGLADLFYIMENSSLINDAMTEELLGVRYIAPLRTSTERYYRYQDLSIDELDHRGDNIGMYIANISSKWRDDLNNWTRDEFKFIIKEKLESNHISINIEHSEASISDNISDMGFGFSQVLPIIIQLWAVASGYENARRRKLLKSYIFAIEQPELHLHPKMQAILSVAFVKSIELAKKNNLELKLLIETHSESIVSKMGKLVASGAIDGSTISVTCFEHNISNRDTYLRTSTYDANGRLDNWPHGFFEY